MLRLGKAVKVQAIAVAGGGADQALVDTVFTHDLLRLDAVLVGIRLKIKVVEKADDLPEVRLVAVAELFRVPAHHVGDGVGVL